MSAKASGAQPNGTPNGDTKSRAHNDGSSTRAYTTEQKAAVLRVKRCKATDFYAILGLEEVKSTCTDAEIKKAYRKLSLLTHPDKNGHEGADDAFKMVSRAFQILSDPSKKQQYDKFGGDPDNRFSSASSASSPFSGFASQRRGGGGAMFEEEISPEELFRQFFGGGMGGFGGMNGGMGMGGPGFAFNMGGMGGPGIRIHQFGGNQPRRRPHNHDQNVQFTSLQESVRALLPLLVLFIIPLFSSLFSGDLFSSRGPSMRFDAAVPPHTLLHTSNRFGVPYWVNPAEVGDYTPSKWKKLDSAAEGKYVNQLNNECEYEREQQQRLAQQAQGFFYTDMEMLERARQLPMKSCRRLDELTRRRY